MSRKGNRGKKSPISGIPKQKTFMLNYYSKEEQHRYQGRFTVNRPTMIQSLEIEGIKSDILKGKYYDPRNPGCGVPPMVALLGEMVAFLQVAVNDAPEWWEGGDGDFSDPSVVYEIYKEAQEVDPFRERIEFLVKEVEGDDRDEGVGDDRAPSDPELDESEPDDSLAEMVD